MVEIKDFINEIKVEEKDKELVERVIVYTIAKIMGYSQQIIDLDEKDRFAVSTKNLIEVDYILRKEFGLPIK